MAIIVNGKKVAGVGAPGKSAYQAAKDGGYVGTEQEFQTILADAISQTEADQRYLQLSGGTMTGELILKGCKVHAQGGGNADQRYQITADDTVESGGFGHGMIPLVGMDPSLAMGYLFTSPYEHDASVGEFGLVSAVDCGGVAFINVGSAVSVSNPQNDYYLPTMYDVKHMVLPKSNKYTLTVAGWDPSAKTQKVAIAGVLADETKQLIMPMPAMASQNDYAAAGIACILQEADALTFKCQTVPTTNIEVFVTVQGVA